jgi:hypothetical protein
MFDVNGFIMKTLRGMIGNYPDFQVREYALNWHSNGKLTEEDLAAIDTMIETQYIENETETEENETDLTEIETETDETVTEEQEATE